jgi:hypothetical protein
MTMSASWEGITVTLETTGELPSLPLWRTVGQAYALWARNFPDLVRACWLWLLVLTPIVAIEAWWRAPHDAALLKAARSAQPFADSSPLMGAAGAIASLIIILPATASIAVAWHRLVLRNEHPSSRIYLRLDSLVIGYGLLLAIIWVPARIIVPLGIFTGNVAAMWLSIVASFALLFILPRISLALPAAALGRNNVTFASAWKATRQNTWRMFWANLICLLPPTVIGDLTARLLPLDPSRTTMALDIAIWDLLPIPLGMIEVGMLSVAYRHFFERGE